MPTTKGMKAADTITIVDLLEGNGIEVWLDGGWGVDALLGKTGIVTERIGPGVPGRVKVDGEDWRGASSDATVLEPGTQVTIIQVDGTTLMVEKEL